MLHGEFPDTVQNFLTYVTEKPVTSLQKTLLIQYMLLKIDFLYFVLLSFKFFDT